MADLVVVAGVVAFFAVATLFVAACDRIIGPDPLPAPSDERASGDASAEVTR